MTVNLSTLLGTTFRGVSGYSGLTTSGYSGFSGVTTSGYSGFGVSGYSGVGTSGYSGFSGVPYTLRNYSTGAQSSIATTRVYVTGSFLQPTAFRAGSTMRWVIGYSKTAVGTTAATYDVAFGTAGSTADTARCSFTGPAQTAVADNACMIIESVVQVYNGASSIVATTWNQTNGIAAPTTGLRCIGSSVVSGAFDLTTASIGAGICFTSATSAVWSINSVYAEFIY